MIYFLFILALAGLIASLYGNYNLIKQNEQLEETTLFYQTKFDEIRTKSLETEIRLKEIDLKGAFAADDEVGFVFKDIKDLSSELTDLITQAYE